MKKNEIKFFIGNTGIQVKKICSERVLNRGNRKGKVYQKGCTITMSSERIKYIYHRLSELRKKISFLDLNKPYYYATFCPENRISNISSIIKNLKRHLKKAFPLISGIYIPEYQLNHYNFVHFHAIITGIENKEINELETIFKTIWQNTIKQPDAKLDIQLVRDLHKVGTYCSKPESKFLEESDVSDYELHNVWYEQNKFFEKNQKFLQEITVIGEVKVIDNFYKQIKDLKLQEIKGAIIYANTKAGQYKNFNKIEIPDYYCSKGAFFRNKALLLKKIPLCKKLVDGMLVSAETGNQYELKSPDQIINVKTGEIL